MNVAISRGLLDQILAHAALSPRQEVCGLLFGDGSRIVSAEPAANVAIDPGRSFELDPAVLLAAHRAARAGGPAIAGFYHSHPSGDPVPSARDAESASAGYLWLIVGGSRAAIFEARQHGAIHGRFHPLALQPC